MVQPQAAAAGGEGPHGKATAKGKAASPSKANQAQAGAAGAAAAARAAAARPAAAQTAAAAVARNMFDPSFDQPPAAAVARVRFDPGQTPAAAAVPAAHGVSACSDVIAVAAAAAAPQRLPIYTQAPAPAQDLAPFPGADEVKGEEFVAIGGWRSFVHRAGSWDVSGVFSIMRRGPRERARLAAEGAGADGGGGRDVEKG